MLALLSDGIFMPMLFVCLSPTLRPVIPHSSFLCSLSLHCLFAMSRVSRSDVGQEVLGGGESCVLREGAAFYYSRFNEKNLLISYAG